MVRRRLLIALIALLPASASADIIVHGNFSATGDIGFPNSPTSLFVTFGNGNGPGVDGNGSIYQMDGFINAQGQNWSNNGSGSGTSAQLSYGLPSGISLVFTPIQTSPHDLLLDYKFTNNTGSALTNFQFLYFLDADIGANFTDEWATQSLTPGAQGNSPSSFQLGDPSLSSIFTNLMNGTLNNQNDFPSSSSPGDVSLALGFKVTTFTAGSTFDAQVLLSDQTTAFSGLTFTQTDPVYTNDFLTISAVPEPSSLALISSGLIGVIAWNRLRHRR
jgi:hypothetical protein